MEIYDRIGEAYFELGLQDKATYFHERYSLGQAECSKKGLKIIVAGKRSDKIFKGELTYEILVSLCLPIQPTSIISSVSPDNMSLRDALLPEDTC